MTQSDSGGCDRRRFGNSGGCEDIIDVRCRGGIHFKVVDGDTIEVKCKHCSDRDSVVLHRYSLPDFTLTATLKLKELRGRGARSHRKETP